MDERYIRYNEITFVMYCMTSIDRAISRGRKEKDRQARIEVPLDEWRGLEDTSQRGGMERNEIELPEAVFVVEGLKVPIVDPDLAKALLSMPPQKRNILLLAYIIGDNDAELGSVLHVSKSAAQRRRIAALKRIQRLMGVTE